MHFSRQLTVRKELTSSLSTLFSKLSSRKILFLSGSHKSPIIDESPSKSSTSKSAKYKSIIGSLYKTLLAGSTGQTTRDKITGYDHQIIVGDLEWWFHGPPGCNHMMRMLTGQSVGNGLANQLFRFEPRSIEVVGDCVIAEGWEGDKVYWVHVWTVRDDDDNNNGAMVITQFREYFNTWLTVKDVTGGSSRRLIVDEEGKKLTMWRSQPVGDVFERSLPGLVLAI